MIKRSLLFALFIFLLSGAFSEICSHTKGQKAIIDTDAAIDDIRAVTMLVNSGIVDVKMITTSDGVLPPKSGARHMLRLTRYFDRQIPVAVGIGLKKNPPDWRKWNLSLNWPEKTDIISSGKMQYNAPEKIIKAINTAKDPVEIICLGPLSNIARALDLDPDIKDNLSRIIYVGGHPNAKNPGWNTLRDLSSARKVFASHIPIFCLNPEKSNAPLLEKSFINKLASKDSNAASLLEKIHSDERVRELIQKRHLKMWDDLVAVYLFSPSMFTFRDSEENVHKLKELNTSKISNIALRLVSSEVHVHISPRKSVILDKFPMRPQSLRADIRPFVQEIINCYGKKEWKLCLLTSELHRHLGTYSIVGAKMGLRARELLHASLGEVAVISLAGDKPPLSCMNDGLQVSTGASLGRGKITVSDVSPEPGAIFIVNDQKLKLELKHSWVQRIRTQIKHAKQQYGGLTQGYFSHIRKQTLKNWLEFDRKQIFEASFF